MKGEPAPLHHQDSRTLPSKSNPMSASSQPADFEVHMKEQGLGSNRQGETGAKSKASINTRLKLDYYMKSSILIAFVSSLFKPDVTVRFL